MTIEIRQLVIRAVVHPAPDVSGSLSGAGITASSLQAEPTDLSGGQDARLENIVATCVKTVLRRLERSHER
jgi:hypothetical protein